MDKSRVEVLTAEERARQSELKKTANKKQQAGKRNLDKRAKTAVIAANKKLQENKMNAVKRAKALATKMVSDCYILMMFLFYLLTILTMHFEHSLQRPMTSKILGNEIAAENSASQ